MEVRFKETDTVVDFSEISFSKGIYYSIKDDVEGDIDINVALTTDSTEEKSFTRYKVLSAHKALIQICNAPSDKYVRTKEKILLIAFDLARITIALIKKSTKRICNFVWSQKA